MVLLFLALVPAVSGQEVTAPVAEKVDNYIFTHLDLGLTLGTDGIAVDLAAPIGHYVQMRIGFSYMPGFQKMVSFQAQVGDTPEARYNPDGTPSWMRKANLSRRSSTRWQPSWAT